MPTNFLHGVEVIEIQEGLRAIRTVRSAVIGLVGSAPKGPINTPILIAGSRTRAVEVFGSSVGTIPDALEANLHADRRGRHRRQRARTRRPTRPPSPPWNTRSRAIG